MRHSKNMVNPKCTRVPCICVYRSARMTLHGTEIGVIIEEANDAGEKDWVIRLNWENLDRMPPFQFPGVDMSLRKKEYIRRELPAVIEQRTMPDTRFNLKEELERVGMTYNDRFEYMCRTHGLAGVNDILMEKINDWTDIDYDVSPTNK